VIVPTCIHDHSTCPCVVHQNVRLLARVEYLEKCNLVLLGKVFKATERARSAGYREGYEIGYEEGAADGAGL
jgi:hypothetical protein